MTSPSPTQAPPNQTPPAIPEYKPTMPTENKPELPAEERKPVQTTPSRKRIGASRTARIIKGILRPPLKVLYYLSTWIKKHKLSALAIIVLLIASTTTTFYYLTDTSPLASQQDPFNFPYNGGKGEGNLVKTWLYALRDGDATHIQLLDQNLQGQPPDPSMLVGQYSQAKTHLKWEEPTVIAVAQQPDTTIDSFVQVPVSASGPGTTLKGIMLWHFVTASINGQDILLGVDLIALRGLQGS